MSLSALDLLLYWLLEGFVELELVQAVEHLLEDSDSKVENTVELAVVH